MDVGFIGLGQMGSAMAANLLRAGHGVRVWNRSPAAAEPLRAAGATIVSAPAEAFSGEAVITMLADDAAYRAVIVDAGLIAEARRPALHINMATVSVALAKEFTALHAAHGGSYLAAPVFGRTEVAVAGQLNIMAAGPEAAVATATPLFEAMGKAVWRVGTEPFHANVVKLAGNYMIAASIQTIAEAMALARANGVDHHLLHEILTGTQFGGRVHTTYGARIADEAFEPAAFKLALGAKDVRLTLAAAEAENVVMPVASLLRDGFIEAIANGDGALDWTALAKVTFRRAGLDQKPD